MTVKKLVLSLVAMFAMLGVKYTADAHVSLNPDSSEPGSREEYNVRVPVEQEDNTVKVELEVPDGVNVANVQPVAGFDNQFEKDDQGNITKITWEATEDGIGPNEFMNFPITVNNPDEEGSFKWNAIQTYDNGDVVEWTSDDENSDTPAPVTEVKKGAGDTEGDSTSSGSTTALWIVSIVSLIIALIALFKRNVPKKDK